MFDLLSPHNIIAGIGEATIGGILYYVYKCIERKVEAIENKFEQYKEKHVNDHKEIYVAIEKVQDKMDRKLDDISDKQNKIFESLSDVKISVNSINTVITFLQKSDNTSN